jgi:hypothetical protein
MSRVPAGRRQKVWGPITGGTRPGTFAKLGFHLEGVKTSSTHAAVIDYCNAWIAEVESAGFVPGVYIGARAILTGEEIFWRLRARNFWKSGSRVPDIPHRGYQLIQKIIRQDKIDGVDIDRNLTVNDNFGQSVLWLASKQFDAK